MIAAVEHQVLKAGAFKLCVGTVLSDQNVRGAPDHRGWRPQRVARPETRYPSPAQKNNRALPGYVDPRLSPGKSASRAGLPITLSLVTFEALAGIFAPTVRTRSEWTKSDAINPSIISSKVSIS